MHCSEVGGPSPQPAQRAPGWLAAVPWANVHKTNTAPLPASTAQGDKRPPRPHSESVRVVRVPRWLAFVSQFDGFPSKFRCGPWYKIPCMSGGGSQASRSPHRHATMSMCVRGCLTLRCACFVACSQGALPVQDAWLMQLPCPLCSTPAAHPRCARSTLCFARCAPLAAAG